MSRMLGKLYFSQLIIVHCGHLSVILIMSVRCVNSSHGLRKVLQLILKPDEYSRGLFGRGYFLDLIGHCNCRNGPLGDFGNLYVNGLKEPCVSLVVVTAVAS
jgi:hypothetical protein